MGEDKIVLSLRLNAVDALAGNFCSFIPARRLLAMDICDLGMAGAGGELVCEWRERQWACKNTSAEVRPSS